jgi:hypothetical protein
MNDAQLAAFRQIADIMLGPEPRDWNWSPNLNAYRPGMPMWQEHGITQARAVRMQLKYGGSVWKSEKGDFK